MGYTRVSCLILVRWFLAPFSQNLIRRNRGPNGPPGSDGLRAVCPLMVQLGRPPTILPHMTSELADIALSAQLEMLTYFFKIAQMEAANIPSHLMDQANPV